MCNRTISHSVHSLYSLLFTSPSSPSPSLPPTHSLPLCGFSLFSLPPFSLSHSPCLLICLPPDLHLSSLPPLHLLILLVLRPPHGLWLQLSRHLLGLPSLSCHCLEIVVTVHFSETHTSPSLPLFLSFALSSSLPTPQWQHVFPWRCWLSLFVR